MVILGCQSSQCRDAPISVRLRVIRNTVSWWQLVSFFQLTLFSQHVNVLYNHSSVIMVLFQFLILLVINHSWSFFCWMLSRISCTPPLKFSPLPRNDQTAWNSWNLQRARSHRRSGAETAVYDARRGAPSAKKSVPIFITRAGCWGPHDGSGSCNFIRWHINCTMEFYHKMSCE